ncbi:hypothetical protein C2W62_10905 [Candidatus Entotheonella serta]|nr:hypothetical protein C2W62_10905 [Candidatus Entotheonella serta]
MKKQTDIGVVIGERLRMALGARERSQRSVALAIGLSTNAINELYKGLKDPSSSTIAALARELDVSADFLLGLTNDIHALCRAPGRGQGGQG